MRPLTFKEYQPKSIVNTHKHVDSWFWDKYSAHPYIGCRYGCEFCYARGDTYANSQTANAFDSTIRVKTNAAALLAEALDRLPVDVIALGDWQTPAEQHYKLSRQMLRVALEKQFPVFIVERSPLLTRDLDLLMDLHQTMWVAVAFSISSLDRGIKRHFEPFSPGVRQRLQAMQTLSAAGILTGTALMPVLPLAGDDTASLQVVIQATKDHGGQFVLAGGLSMSGTQAQRTLAAYQKFDSALPEKIRKAYQWHADKNPNNSTPKTLTRRLGRQVRALCEKIGLKDRMPRFIPKGPLGENRRLAEILHNIAYQLELENNASYRIWAYRKAAWRIDELDDPIRAIYQSGGAFSLKSLPDIGEKMAKVIIKHLDQPQIF